MSKTHRAGEASLQDYIIAHEAEKAAWRKVLDRLTSRDGWHGGQKPAAADPICTPSEWADIERELAWPGAKDESFTPPDVAFSSAVSSKPVDDTFGLSFPELQFDNVGTEDEDELNPIFIDEEFLQSMLEIGVLATSCPGVLALMRGAVWHAQTIGPFTASELQLTCPAAAMSEWGLVDGSLSELASAGWLNELEDGRFSTMHRL